MVKYKEARKTNVKYEEVLWKWRVDQLTLGLVHEYLKTASPVLANEFNVRYQPDETKLQGHHQLSRAISH